jgi:hypothetical protein
VISACELPIATCRITEAKSVSVPDMRFRDLSIGESWKLLFSGEAMHARQVVAVFIAKFWQRTAKLVDQRRRSFSPPTTARYT